MMIAVVWYGGMARCGIRRTTMRIVRWSLGFTLLVAMAIPAGIAAARPRPGQQDDPVADAARRAQAEKKSQSAPQKVWTNDNIPTTPGAVSIIGTPDAPTTPGNIASSIPAPAAADNSSQPANNTSKAADTDSKRAGIQTDLDAAKEQLKIVATDLDILTRKYALDSQTYHSKPDFASDTAGAAQLQDEQVEIDAKKQEVDDAQKKVDDLQAQFDALNPDKAATADSGTASTPTDTSSSTSKSNSGGISLGKSPNATSDTSGGNTTAPSDSNSTTPSN
jgi:hypothetical protein